ncbi:MAG TPA: hypothetical protein VII47_09840, partial [Actinomycetota bacterium]
PRERLLLVLWYVSDMPPTVIARQLNVSRVHCYRLRDKALRALCDVPGADGPPSTTATATTSPGALAPQAAG